MKLKFLPTEKPESIPVEEWSNWGWQMRKALTSMDDFSKLINLSSEEFSGFTQGEKIFNIKVTPYYMKLIEHLSNGPIRKMVIPQAAELEAGHQAMLDPLGERKNNPAPRVIHRYSDRALFLVTDFCSVYCRYCTRKHFTGQEQSLPKNSEYQQALNYFRSHPGIREIIISGGDPLTLADSQLERILADLRTIDHIEIIRIGTRMPVVCPMRVTPELTSLLRKHKPVFLMTHFNHPSELTAEAATALEAFVDSGIPVMNQLVLLNGVNNHPAIIQALSRRLLYLRVKPYYMFQCDPSFGTDHLRTSVEDSLEIQRELWGHLSGLAMPTLSLDIPNGGGKTTLVPNFQLEHSGTKRVFKGWDGITCEYISPEASTILKPFVADEYLDEWEKTKNAKALTP